MYGVIALSLAFFQFRKGEPGLISATLKPIFGKKMVGPWGILVDVLAVFATAFGVATSLGFGAVQINAGLNYLFDVKINIFSQFVIIAVVTVLFVASAWSGLSKGIKYLSNTNLGACISPSRIYRYSRSDIAHFQYVHRFVWRLFVTISFK